MGRAITMENKVDKLEARVDILSKRVKLLELEFKQMNDKATKVTHVKNTKKNATSK